MLRTLAALLAFPLAVLAAPPPASAAPLHAPAHLNEEVVLIRAGRGLNAADLETTLFRPSGPGPFPLVVINHGKAPGSPALQERARFLAASREFVRRGYAVALPMRSGFSKSSGSYVSGGCNLTSNGEMQAGWIEGAIGWLREQPFVDPERIVVLGQSHGGLATLALGTRPPAGVRGLVNFAGGLKWDACNWQGDLLSAARSYGARSTIPTLWFYGDNDSHFPPALWREMLERYTAGGGQAQLVAFGRWGSDAHKLFPSAAGVSVWLPEVERFLASLGMPHAPVVQVEPPRRPAASDFAPLADTAALPYVRESGRKAYARFLAEPLPRAFAVSPTGAWGYAVDGDEPLERALRNCQRESRTACRLYAVDEDVVWSGEPGLVPSQRASAPAASATGGSTP